MLNFGIVLPKILEIKRVAKFEETVRTNRSMQLQRMAETIQLELNGNWLSNAQMTRESVLDSKGVKLLKSATAQRIAKEITHRDMEPLTAVLMATELLHRDAHKKLRKLLNIRGVMKQIKSYKSDKSFSRNADVLNFIEALKKFKKQSK